MERSDPACQGIGFRELIVFLRPLLRKRSRPLTFAVLLSLIASGAALAQPVVVSSIIRDVGSGAALTKGVTTFGGLLLVATFAQWGQSRILERSGEYLLLAVREKLMEHVLRLPIPSYSHLARGDLVSRFTADTTALRTLISGGVVKVASSLTLAIGAVVGMVLVDRVLFSISLAAVLLLSICISLVSRGLRLATLHMQTDIGTAATHLEETVARIRTIRAANATDEEAEVVRLATERAAASGLRAADVTAAMLPLNTLGLQLVLIIILGTGGMRVASGAADTASLITFVMFLFMLLAPIGQAINAMTEIVKAQAAFARIEEVLTMAIETDTDGASKTATDIPMHAELELRHVTLRYPTGTLALRGVNLVAKPGQITALVGRSGAGKTSIFDSIERFFPISGTLLINGVDCRSLSNRDLRRHITYIEQDSPIVSGSLRRNLLLEVRNSTDGECLAALDVVGLLDFCQRDPQGLDMRLTGDGESLSGGERQRLSIARALLSRRPIVLLDEPTANLDAISESRIRNALDALSARKTLIVIAHRLSTIQGSHVIHVIEDGRVTASGTHGELIKNSKFYRDMVEHQRLLDASGAGL